MSTVNKGQDLRRAGEREKMRWGTADLEQTLHHKILAFTVREVGGKGCWCALSSGMT